MKPTFGPPSRSLFQVKPVHRTGSPPDADQLPLHAILQPSIESIEEFLADEAKEMELLAAHHLLTMSQSQPSPENISTSDEEERQRQEEEYARMVEEQQIIEEDEEDDYWKSYNEQLY